MTLKAFVFIPLFIGEIFAGVFVVVLFFLGMRLDKTLIILAIASPFVVVTATVALNEINKNRIKEDEARTKKN